MSKKPTTLVHFVLDQTGSMGSVIEATISGFNEYVNTLRNQTGKVLFTLTLFNSAQIVTPNDAVKLKDVQPLSLENYKPDSMTNLYDAIAHSIRATEQTVASMKDKPAVLMVIMTDGHENASKEFNREAVFQQIQAHTAAGWTFAYLGANQDAWSVGASIGVAANNSLTYDQQQTQKTFRQLGRVSARYLNNATPGAAAANFFSGDDA